MSCTISSYKNRTYGVLETTPGMAGNVSTAARIPVSGLSIREERIESRRLDKVGGRSFVGTPSNGRESSKIRLRAYLTEWCTGDAAPSHDALLRATMGGEALMSTGNTIASITGGLTVATTTPHGLTVGQAVCAGGEIRFVDSVPSPSTIVINFPFGAEVTQGDALTRTISYTLGDGLRTLTVADYWDPIEAIQRCVTGFAVNELSIGVNGDFHEFGYTGEGRRLIDSSSFVAGMSGLNEFPPEPVSQANLSGLVPGSIGQAWVGLTTMQSMNVLMASVRLTNQIDYRRREFGNVAGGCITGGVRDVRVDLRLKANDSQEMTQLHAASRTREAVPVMFQLGAMAGQVAAVYMPRVVLTPPYLDDKGVSLEWEIRDSRAQGGGDDELYIAFG